MAQFAFVTFNTIEQDVDPKTGELKTFRVNCTELAPRNFNINLMKQPDSRRKEIQALIGQSVMVPVKEGRTSDGQVYFQLEPGQIIPVAMPPSTVHKQHDEKK